MFQQAQKHPESRPKILEKTIEKQLTTEVRKRGGHAYKLVSPNKAGMPDRLVCLPHGKSAFIELKAPGQKARPIQKVRHQELQNLGQTVHIIDNTNQIKEVLDEIQTT